MAVDGYAGDKTPQEAWDILADARESVMIDVRTVAEWEFVGTPNLSTLGKNVCLVAWLEFPDMRINQGFVQAVSQEVPGPDSPILLICRSGQRSISAAKALTEAGFTACYNVLEGFEGDKCPDSRRGSVGGWKVHGLPWHQK